MKTETTTEAPTVGSSALFCDCVNWCRDGRDMFSEHHPRCKHYEPPPDDPRYARFGKAMWEMIRKHGEEFCWDEWSEDVLPLAEKARLCQRVKYDPEKHGEMEAEPGSEIWWWGEVSVPANA